MENLSIKIDLAKLNGAFIKEIAGRTETKNCLVIPINDASLFQGQKGIYLDLLAREMKDSRYGDTHIVKQNLPKEKYQALTEDERRNQPILGSAKVMSGYGDSTPGASNATRQPSIPSNQQTDDLPF